LISGNTSVRDSEEALIPNKPLHAVSPGKNPQQGSPDANQAPESKEELWKNKRFCCDHCRQPGDVHFRVITARLADWILVCETCWPNFCEQAVYRYGGTRKANRRKRKRR